MVKKLLQDLITINEAFDTVFDSVRWSKQGQSMYVAECRLDGTDFTLNIEGMNFRVGAELRTYLNLAFTRVVDGQYVQTLVNTGENQTRAFGAIFNELRKKVRELDGEFELDALVMIAVSAETKRLSLYRRALASKAYGLQPWQLRAEVRAMDGTALVATKEPLPKDAFDALRAELERRGKALISA
jgi:hypothetical protein